MCVPLSGKKEQCQTAWTSGTKKGALRVQDGVVGMRGCLVPALAQSKTTRPDVCLPLPCAINHIFLRASEKKKKRHAQSEADRREATSCEGNKRLGSACCFLTQPRTPRHCRAQARQLDCDCFDFEARQWAPFERLRIECLRASLVLLALTMAVTHTLCIFRRCKDDGRQFRPPAFGISSSESFVYCPQGFKWITWRWGSAKVTVNEAQVEAFYLSARCHEEVTQGEGGRPCWWCWCSVWTNYH